MPSFYWQILCTFCVMSRLLNVAFEYGWACDPNLLWPAQGSHTSWKVSRHFVLCPLRNLQLRTRKLPVRTNVPTTSYQKTTSSYQRTYHFVPEKIYICISCFLQISQSILNRFIWNFARTIFESCGDYREIFIKNYYVVQKLDHLTCSKF